MEKLLQHRRIVKAKKPVFNRQDAHKKGKLKSNWRKPKGSDSKMRVRRRGYNRCVSVGWGSPAEVKGFSRQGLKIVNIANMADLSKVDPKTECVVVLSTVGLKKRLLIFEEALKKGVKVANIKDLSAFMEQKKAALKEKKDSSESKRKSRAEKKEKVEKEAKKKAEKDKKDKEEAKDEGSAPEDKKAEEKKEKDKVLTQRQ